MHLFITLCLLIACGIVDATFYNQRAQLFKQLNERRQRSIGLPYGYNYNPIEPSMDFLDNLSETFDSTINTYKPIHQYVKMSTEDANPVPRTNSYHPKNAIYDSEYVSTQEIPNLLPEDSYDYKYLASPLNKYLTPPFTPENDIGVNLVAIRKTSVLGYDFPTYKSQDSRMSLYTKYPYTHLAKYYQPGPEISEVSPPAVVIVELLPESLNQESTATTTENSYDLALKKLFLEILNAPKNSVKDEPNYEVTQETLTENESNPITSDEIQTLDRSSILVLEENQTNDESNSLTIEETQSEESNSLTTEETQTEDESNSLTTEETQTEDESNSLTTEETQTEDESNSITTKDEPNFDTTEDESELNTTEGKLFSFETEENQTENDESKTTTSQETTATAFDSKFLDSDEDSERGTNINFDAIFIE